MEIKANKELFDRWRLLGSRIAELGCIVQNDMDVPETRVRGWLETTKIFREEYNRLIHATLSHLDVWVEFDFAQKEKT